MSNKLPKIIFSGLIALIALSLFFAWLGTPAKVSKYKTGTPEQLLEAYLDKKIGIDPDNIRSIVITSRPDIPGQRLSLKFKNSNSVSKFTTLDSYLRLNKKFAENPPPFEIVHLEVWTVFNGTAGDGSAKEVKEGNFSIDYILLKENINKIDSVENFEKFLNARGTIFVRNYAAKD